MPRIPRIYSNSKVYHIILKGIDDQDIFYDDRDREFFLKQISITKIEFNYMLYSYCLMSNHVHMVIRCQDIFLSKSIQSLLIRYVYYFNKKYKRKGPLVQDRFKSKQVECLQYLIDGCRYVHRNPENAGIELTQNYKWSSYREYTNKMTKLDTSFALELLDGQENFEEYINCINDDCCLEVKESNSMTDKQAKKILEQEFGLTSFLQITNMPVPERNKLLYELKSKGLSVRQLARMTGLNRGVVQKA